jgi:hypothetical protein
MNDLQDPHFSTICGLNTEAAWTVIANNRKETANETLFSKLKKGGKLSMQRNNITIQRWDMQHVYIQNIEDNKMIEVTASEKEPTRKQTFDSNNL